MKHRKVGNIAFWRYDLHPFNSAKIVAIHNSASYPGRGHIEAQGYGKGWFKPAFCLPAKEGAALANAIESIDAQYERDCIAAAARRTAKIAALIPEGISVWR